MNIQKNFAVVCAALAALPTAFAETASVERDAAALATTDDYVNAGSVVRKDEDKISIFNDLLTVNGSFRVRADSLPWMCLPFLFKAVVYLERMTGIEPAPTAWEAGILP